ncbi:hypothetical protein KQ247_05485 [Ruegeria pomeroyi]|nr:hypothetical protein [Ruegeria pomeroyi]NVK96102.1 hypothetical protein [Ruegeria pomeroyi]NVL03402.1 hypothetical protein [Ruegeria pomeroyi]QWV10053.1 hypothetical protein KQ247_05485 [Ruegeria pomeroyi]HCE72537.1 hypothetical protein [Ruegeria sp.]
MVVRFLVFALALICGQSLLAAPSAETIRASLLAHDFDMLTADLEASQAAFDAGDISDEDLRRLFEVFTSSSPDVIEAVAEWERKSPDLPYATTARGWSLYITASRIRGEDFARDPYPEALRLHREMLERAFLLAMRAYGMDPSLIPASDLIIALGNSTSRQEQALVVVERVMSEQPNAGTLRRAIWLAHPGWGGSSELADALCAFFGPNASPNGADLTRQCITYASREIFGHRMEEIRTWMKEDPDPWYDYYRVWATLFDKSPNAEDLAFAHRYFQDSEVRDLRLSKMFDQRYSMRPGLSPVHHLVLERSKDWARAVLETDPYELSALDVLLSDTVRVTKGADNNWMFTPSGSPTRDERLDYMRRRLYAAPYNPDFWEDYARFLNNENKQAGYPVEGIFATDTLMINAIVYSKHRPDWLGDFVERKFKQLEFLEWITGQGKPDWDRFIAETDRNAQIICPLIRANRLFDAMRLAGLENRRHKDLSVFKQQKLRAETERAASEGQCENERLAPIEALWFTPVEVDLAAMG